MSESLRTANQRVNALRCNAFREQGDFHRDLKSWRRAALSYKAYLDQDPKSFAIWVQYANCLKEDGDFDLALSAYRTALALKPRDADVNLQLGHLHKILGNPSEAIRYYRVSYEGDPLGPAFGELVTLGEAPDLPDVEAVSDDATRKHTYFDVTDVVSFLSGEVNLSGIQRVIANIFAASHSTNRPMGDGYKFCLFDQTESAIRPIPSQALQRVFKLIQTPDVSREILDYALMACRGHRPIKFMEGDRFIILGAFWSTPSYSELLMKLRDKRVFIGVFIYDLIPITHNIFVEPVSGGIFKERILQILALSDFAMAISDFVAKSLRTFVRREIGRDLPIHAVPLAQEIVETSDHQAVGSAVRAVSDRPFILSVGTIEGRKNHIYLFRMWQRMIATYGEAATPTLVIVGRWSWRVEEFRQMLSETHYLDGKIVVLSHVADSELSYLYNKCLLTIFPSLVEGWGLPVGESLAHGKVCIASNTTSIPEVGGNFAEYVDPLNVSDGVAKVRQYLDDRSALSMATARIEREFKPRTWVEVVGNLQESIERLAADAAANARIEAYCTLPTGVAVRIGAEAIKRRAQRELRATTFPLMCVSGWHPTEEWGCWSSALTSTLKFRVEGISQVTTLRLGLLLSLPNPEFSTVIHARSLDVVSDIDLQDGQRHWYFLNAKPSADGSVTVVLDVKGKIPQVEPKRRIYVGLSAVIVVEAGDLRQRIEMMEELLKARPSL